MRSLAIGANGLLERLPFRPKDESVTCQDLAYGFANRLGEGAILFAKIKQRHAHGAKSMAVSVFRSRKIDFESGSATSILFAYRTEFCGELGEQVRAQR